MSIILTEDNISIRIRTSILRVVKGGVLMAAQNNSPTGWVGWGYFAGFMMMMLGVFEGIAGLAAIFKDNFYVATENSLLVFNYTAWGWISLVLGILLLMAGLELLRGAMWARVLAIFLAGLSLIANMSFVEAYPIWSITMMVVDVLVIYALTVHGAELRE
jgi:hypothetical protein